MSKANPWYKICDKRALEGRKNDLFRPSRALLPFPKSRGSQKALAPGYCLAPLRGFGKLPESSCDGASFIEIRNFWFSRPKVKIKCIHGEDMVNFVPSQMKFLERERERESLTLEKKAAALGLKLVPAI
jgi:hypothetical protein